MFRFWGKSTPPDAASNAGPVPTSREQVREWTKGLRHEMRQLDRQVRGECSGGLDMLCNFMHRKELNAKRAK